MDKVVYFYFEGRLNDFLSDKKNDRLVKYVYNGKPAIKDAFEAIGVPHVEVGEIRVEGMVKTPNEPLIDGGQIEVLPSKLLSPDSGWRFIADSHLGKLVKELRILGFDTYYQSEANEKQTIAKALEENRILLSRSIKLLKYKTLANGYWIRSKDPMEQIREVVSRFALRKHFHPFTRCLVCNAPIASVSKTEVQAELPEITNKVFDQFYQCTGCKKVYWKGGHFDRMQKFIEQVE